MHIDASMHRGGMFGYEARHYAKDNEHIRGLLSANETSRIQCVTHQQTTWAGAFLACISVHGIILFICHERLALVR